MSVVKHVDKTESEQIWQEIKDLPILVFALPNQTVKQHVMQVPMPGKELLLRLVSTAVLPSLEESLGKRYEVVVAEGYVTVKRASTREVEVKKALAPFLVVK